MKKRITRRANKLFAILLSLVLIVSIFALPAFATDHSTDAVVVTADDSGISLSNSDTYGWTHWPTLSMALEYYGALGATWVGVSADQGGQYNKYYVQMSNWRIYFGVHIP